MAQNDWDWQIFLTHESNLRRNINRPLIEINNSLRREFDALADPHAYAQGLLDIANALEPASHDFHQAEILSQAKIDNPDDPWNPREIGDLRRFHRSQVDLWNALQRFTTEQKRIRASGISNADETSRDWTKQMVQQTRMRKQYIQDLWLQARASVHAARARAQADAEAQAHATQDPDDADDARNDDARNDDARNDDARNDVAGNVVNGLAAEEEEEEEEDDEEPVRPLHGARRPGGQSNGRKRGRDPTEDYESHDSQTSKKTPRSNDRSGPAIREEPEASNEIPLMERAPLEQEVDPLAELEERWQAILEECDEVDRPAWQTLYSRARKLVNANLPGMVPEDLAADTMADFRTRVNIALEQVLGWDWEEHIDIIKAADDDLFQEGDLKRARILREASMQKAREGHSPIWPPVRRQEPLVQIEEPPPGPTISSPVQARLETADGIVSDLLWEGSSLKPGEWSYLATVGRGGHGEAQLWTGIRSDDHGMIVERIVVKCFSIEHTWANESTWIANSFTGNEKWLRERAMHAQLSSVGSASGIVQYRGATSSAERHRMQRIYMEYCPHGDLRVLWLAHAKSDGFDPLFDEDNQPVPPVRIPVRALWSFFKDMAAAACTMKHGYDPLDKDADEPEEWTEIIHRDFKPSNIFLAAPLAKTGRGIPVCKMGDFGLTVPRDYEPLINPESMWYSGTPGWKAPEYNPYSQSYEPFHELSSATDVWAIGRTMLVLMQLPIKTPPVIRYDDDDEGHVVVGAKAELVAAYGEELSSLVEKCLERIPGDRIKARDLLRAIDRLFSNPLVTLPLELREEDVLEYSQELRWAT